MEYWDTSALLKLYVQESDSEAFVERLLGSVRAAVTSELARVEIFSALRRKEQLGALVPGAADKLFQHFVSGTSQGGFAILPLGADVTAKAVELVAAAYRANPPIMIRSLDVVHVASAVLAGCTILVGTDLRQREVAALAGLALFP